MDQCDQSKPPAPAPQEDLEVWSRVFAKRQKEWSQIDSRDVQALVVPLLRKGDLPPPPASAKAPHEKLGFIIQQYFSRSLDSKLSVSERRNSWDVARGILSKTDQILGKRKSNNAAGEDPASNTSSRQKLSGNTQIAKLNTKLSDSSPKSCFGPKVARKTTNPSSTAQITGKEYSSTSTNVTMLNLNNKENGTKNSAISNKKSTSGTTMKPNGIRNGTSADHHSLNIGRSLTSSEDTMLRHQKSRSDNNTGENHVGASTKNLAHDGPARQLVNTQNWTDKERHVLQPKTQQHAAHGEHKGNNASSQHQGTSSQQTQNPSAASVPSERLTSVGSKRLSTATVQTTPIVRKTQHTLPSESQYIQTSVPGANAPRPPEPASQSSHRDSGATPLSQLTQTARGQAVAPRGELPPATVQRTTARGEAPPSNNSNTSDSTMGVVLSAVAADSCAPNVDTSPGKSISESRTSTPTPADPPKSPPQPAEPVRVLFQADNITPLKSCALEPRSVVRVTFSPQSLSRNQTRQLSSRLKKWEPFWTTKHSLVQSQTSKITEWGSLIMGEKPMTAAECSILMLPTQYKLVTGWGSPLAPAKRGDYRLLLRMLPLKRRGKKQKRADTHLWPRGTFLQVNGRPVAFRQRKQQSHDKTLWKGTSHALDLTPFISDPTSLNKIQICCYDEETYAVSVAVSQYNPVPVLYDEVMSEWLQHLSLEEAKERAIEYVNRLTVTVDDESDDEDSSNAKANDGGTASQDGDSGNSLSLSLNCPISKTLIQTPVRGSHCKHFQCFDLRNFLQTNEPVSGGRWRCSVCEEFVSCHDLQRCGLYDTVLTEFANVARPDRDRVLIRPNGTWKLMDEAKKRYTNRKALKRRISETSLNGGSDTNNNKKAKPQETLEIIDIG